MFAAGAAGAMAAICAAVGSTPFGRFASLGVAEWTDSEEGEVQLWALPITIVDRPRWKYRGIKVG